MDNEYLIICPENGGILDVLHFLFFSRRGHRFIDYLEHVEDRTDTFDRRWIITVSILTRKILHLVAKPMAFVGACMEFMLNLISNNGGLQGIMFKALTGPNILSSALLILLTGSLFCSGRGMIIPQRNSETFISAIGHLDLRMDLDTREINGLGHHGVNGSYNGGTGYIQVGSRYLADVCIIASKLAYEMSWLSEMWLQNVGRVPGKKIDDKLVVVAFRGIEPFDADDWSTDLADRCYEQILKTGEK